MSGFSPSKKSYGGGAGRFVLMKVTKGGRQDPEQAGRLRCRVVGYQDDEGSIPDDQLPWCRPMGSPTNPQNGGIGGPLTGAMEPDSSSGEGGSVMYGFYSDGAQQPIIMGSAGKAGKDDSGQGELDQSGKNHDLNRHSRDEDKGGGDFRYDAEKKDYGDKGIVTYARDEAKNPYDRKESKDADDSPEKSYSIGQDQYA